MSTTTIPPRTAEAWRSPLAYYQGVDRRRLETSASIENDLDAARADATRCRAMLREIILAWDSQGWTQNVPDAIHKAREVAQ